jgi:hypothetical protein
MKITIHCNHPISNPIGANTRWDDKIREYEGDPLDVKALGSWLTRQLGFRFNYKPGHSRVADGRCVFFPARRKVGVHAIWIEPVNA